MRKSLKLLKFSRLMLMGALLCTGMLYSCGSASGVSSQKPDASELGFNSVLDLLRREPNLTIRGDGPNASVTMRGVRSLEGTNEPLFVLDGTPLGFGYSNASSIDVNNVMFIRVLSPAQSGLYGSRGGNGVIQITSKR